METFDSFIHVLHADSVYGSTRLVSIFFSVVSCLFVSRFQRCPGVFL